MNAKLLTFLLSALGGFLGYLIAHHSVGMGSAVAATQTISATRIELVDSRGMRQIVMGTSAEGSPAIWFFDRHGKNRLNLGLYGDGNAEVVLNDDSERAVQILRSVGSASAPVLVQKSSGTDRLVMGIGWAVDREPFLALYDAQGTKRTLFGRY
ncbi:MAG TPA: hypothetical protein VML91_05385 [Burkholderiales bacterium]|nr:hypothetical protein [Burkholderiales bacterium]